MWINTIGTDPFCPVVVSMFDTKTGIKYGLFVPRSASVNDVRLVISGAHATSTEDASIGFAYYGAEGIDFWNQLTVAMMRDNGADSGKWLEKAVRKIDEAIKNVSGDMQE